MTVKQLKIWICFVYQAWTIIFSPYIEGEAEAGIIKQMTETFYEQLRRRRMNSSHYVVLIGLHLLDYLNQMCCILIHLVFYKSVMTRIMFSVSHHKVNLMYEKRTGKNLSFKIEFNESIIWIVKQLACFVLIHISHSQMCDRERERGIVKNNI